LVLVSAVVKAQTRPLSTRTASRPLRRQPALPHVASACAHALPPGGRRLEARRARTPAGDARSRQFDAL